VLRPFVEETCAHFGHVPWAAIGFGLPDPDAEIERIVKRIGVDLAMDF
jgi:hypothetical protein